MQAPEVYTKKPYTEKADVYSYGIMAYEILHYYMLIAATNGSYAECEVGTKQTGMRRMPCGTEAARPSHLVLGI